jgi:hypothetical protein
LTNLLKKSVLLAAVAAGSLAVAGCATETAFAPATGHGYNRQGYTDHQIEPNRFEVTFSGNDVTSRDTVERYLLFRAAQLTVQSGADYFILVDRNTDKHSETYADAPFGPGPWGGWGVSWRFYGRGFGRYGYRDWDPFWGGGWGGGFGGPWGPGFNDFDIRTVESYEAHAEIVTGRGPKPNNVRAFDAHRVIESLGPTIKTPQDKARH